MSGPRITTGKYSKQDYRTPQVFLTAVKKRFGPIMFDLAAHGNNHVHRDYFAPAEFTERLELGSLTTDIIMAMADSLRARGVSATDLVCFTTDAMARNAYHRTTETRVVREYTLQNSDTMARAFDSLAQPWHKIGGLLWLNCPFDDIKQWSRTCAMESRRGAEILSLTPASIGANWMRDHVAPHADIYSIGRVSFDGKNVFMKDLFLSHFHSHDTQRSLSLWDWKKNVISMQWSTEK